MQKFLLLLLFLATFHWLPFSCTILWQHKILFNSRLHYHTNLNYSTRTFTHHFLLHQHSENYMREFSSSGSLKLFQSTTRKAHIGLEWETTIQVTVAIAIVAIIDLYVEQVYLLLHHTYIIMGRSRVLIRRRRIFWHIV